MTNQTIQGRNDLLAWEQHKPDNFFTADTNLQNVLRRYLGDNYDATQADLTKLGAETATIMDEAAKIEDRIGNHPRLERWSGLGERIEQIEFHPNHDRIGRLVWASGIMALQAEAGNTVKQMGLYYLLTHNGEGGHLCSLACTSGLIRALQHAASDDVRTKFLPPLLNPDYDQMQHGAQFLTEVQGGSDVGANAVTATPAEDGTWRINGEKWFCSNINADQFLMTARANDSEGTRGLGLFLVPRKLDDGSVNGFYIRRLKDKLGTRTLASAELDFQDAVAYPVGAVERGFKTVVELVLNTSRLMNAIACAGFMRRVYIEAGQYACHRQAFGQAIASFPMVQEAIADIMSATYAATASSFYLAHLLDKIETGQASEQDEKSYRMLVNINKYITSITGTQMIHRGIEVLGGNGAIESFSILPRLYRDMVVLESWEGTHNVLCVQVVRDISRYSVHEAFIADMQNQLATVHYAELSTGAEIVRSAIDRLMRILVQIAQKGEMFAQAHGRRMVDLAAYIAQATLLLVEAQWELDNQLPTFKPDVTAYFINQHLTPDYDPMLDDNYIKRLERLMTAL
jgi:acyl-CoA dehydrogenase